MLVKSYSFDAAVDEANARVLVRNLERISFLSQHQSHVKRVYHRGFPMGD